MLETQDQSNPLRRSKLIGRCIVSCIFLFLTHLALSFVPRFFSAFSFLAQLALSALLLLVLVGFGGWCRRTLLRAKASAPAFVFFNILFIWGVYFSVIQQAVPQLNDPVFNWGVVFLFIGFYRSASSTQPMEISISQVGNHHEVDHFQLGEMQFVMIFLLLQELELSDSGLGMRVRYCKSCKAYIKGLDHHCPAFGNCIGQNNHPLFLILLFGFISTEVSYLVCSSLFAAKSGILDRPSPEHTLSECLAVSTILFTILQLVWQTNWKKYEEFQLVVQPQPGQSFTSIRFRNPYDKRHCTECEGVSSIKNIKVGNAYYTGILA